jgi:hypothetical protein
MPQLPSAMLGALLAAPLPRADMEAPPEGLATQRSPPPEAAIAHQEREESIRDLGARDKVKAARAAVAQVRRPGAEAPPLARGGRSARAETQPWDPPEPPAPAPRSTLWMWVLALLRAAAAVALVFQALQTPRPAARHGRATPPLSHRSLTW